MALSPVISILLPLYNAEPTLAFAVTSILSQSHENFELLLIDDGSFDCSVDIAKSFSDPRIRVIMNTDNRGLPFRLNQGIELCRGKYIARMDADDIAFPERLSAQLQYMLENPEVDLVGTAMLVFGDDGNAIGTYRVPASHIDICKRPWSGFYLPHPTWFGKESFFKKYRYNPKATKAQDQELLLRAYRHSRFANIRQVLLGYRQEHLSIRKSFIGRYIFSKAIASHYAQTREYYRLGRGITEQILKVIADSLVIGAGLNRLLFTHRADPAGLNPDLLRRWQDIWKELGTNRCAV